MVEIVTEKFKLRPLNQADAEVFHLGINTRQIAEDTTIPTPWELNSIKWWIDYINNAALQIPIRELHFAIEVENMLAGSVGIINIDGHKAEIGYWLKENYAGRGIMSEVIDIVANYAFEKMNLKRLFAPILPHNKASGRVLEKNGFIIEGVLRKYYFKDGKYVDAICYAKIVE